MRKLTLTTLLLITTVLTTFAQDTFLDKGNSYLNNEQFDKAEQTFREAIKSDTTNLIYQCQLGLTLIQAKKYADGEAVLNKVFKTDSNNVAAIWYSGIGNFYNSQDKQAINRFEKALTLLDKKSGQYYSANWFIGKSYSNLLKTDGLTYTETDRMFECYEEYLRSCLESQRNQKDSQKKPKFEVCHSLFRLLMEVLSKDTIRTWILPSLTFSSLGRPSAVDPVELVEVILYKLKTGCQWRFVPVKQFFTGASLTWSGVYARFNAWRKDGSWQRMWLHLLRQQKAHLDCSSVQLDGSHTPAKNGGQAIGYQARKRARTTTALFLADNCGQPLACATPQAGNHHDSYHLGELFAELCAQLEAADIPLDGLFLNADSAFDTTELRQACAARDIQANIARNRRATDWQTNDDTFFDAELYQRRIFVEHTNAWLDSFKTLLVRYETTVGNWLAWHWLAFTVLFLRRIDRNPTF